MILSTKGRDCYLPPSHPVYNFWAADLFQAGRVLVQARSSTSSRPERQRMVRHTCCRTCRRLRCPSLGGQGHGRRTCPHLR